MRHTIEHAILFTPGRASYLDEEFTLHLSDASKLRASVAATTFDPDFHDYAVFAGGYPGEAENWPQEHRDAVEQSGQSEALLMSRPLLSRMGKLGMLRTVEDRIKIQGDSNNSIGDIRLSIEKGYLDPEAFANDESLGLELVTGSMHGIRFKRGLSKALDLNPARIRRVGMQDLYGSPKTHFREAVPQRKAIITECGALAVNEYVRLMHIRRGQPATLAAAESSFNRIAKQLSGSK